MTIKLTSRRDTMVLIAGLESLLSDKWGLKEIAEKGMGKRTTMASIMKLQEYLEECLEVEQALRITDLTKPE
jgi:N-dimethylarginine dimethylaminohydrolase